MSAKGFLRHLDFYITPPPQPLPQQLEPVCLDPAILPSAVMVSPQLAASTLRRASAHRALSLGRPSQGEQAGLAWLPCTLGKALPMWGK